MDTSNPTEQVLEAFSVEGEPRLLDGGQGGTWRAGTVVLKPTSLPAETRWRASVLDALPDTDWLRIARPLRAISGDWLHEGWEASQYLAGETDPSRWNTAIESGEAFHELLAAVPRPSFLDSRNDWWSIGDRIAWDLTDWSNVTLLRQLMNSREPISVEEQLVHGDLLGNILYAEGLPPAVIDWAPYWRPTSWAAAVAAVDALCWHGADEEVVERWAHLEEWPQMLVRALLYRMMTDQQAARSRGENWQPHPAYEPVGELVLART